MNKIYFLFLLIPFFFISCIKKSDTLPRKAIGKINTISVITTAPLAPTAVAASNFTCTSMNANWSASAGATRAVALRRARAARRRPSRRNVTECHTAPQELHELASAIQRASRFSAQAASGVMGGISSVMTSRPRSTP